MVAPGPRGGASRRARGKGSVTLTFGGLLLAIGLTASVASAIAAQEGHSDQSHQLGGLTTAAVLGWLMTGRRHPLTFLVTGIATGLTWILLGAWLTSDAHSAGPYALSGGIAVTALAVIGATVAHMRSPSRRLRESRDRAIAPSGA